jgi:hyperosmotically inducible periplasmic protein
MKTKLIAATLASLVVGGFAASGAFADETVGQKITNATLVAKVKAELLKSPDVSGLAVNVDAKNGMVTLSGSAKTDTERSKAEQIAQSTSGVVGKVDNKIVIKPASN